MVPCGSPKCYYCSHLVRELHIWVLYPSQTPGPGQCVHQDDCQPPQLVRTCPDIKQNSTWTKPSYRPDSSLVCIGSNQTVLLSVLVYCKVGLGHRSLFNTGVMGIGKDNSVIDKHWLTEMVLLFPFGVGGPVPYGTIIPMWFT